MWTAYFKLLRADNVLKHEVVEYISILEMGKFQKEK
jgi:hypothetical protein